MKSEMKRDSKLSLDRVGTAVTAVPFEPLPESRELYDRRESLTRIIYKVIKTVNKTVTFEN